MIIITTAIFAASLALVLGIALCVFRKVFHVETDVLVGLIRETLPGANCGACGFPGCDGFAAACAAKEADPGLCSVSDEDSTKKRASLVGGEASSAKPVIAMVACQGLAAFKGNYTGYKSCRAAKISAGGRRSCAWGCIGFGDCINECAFGAITMAETGVPVIDRKKCKGCKKCFAECPQGVIRVIDADAKGAFALCNNRSPIKASVRKACKAGCFKCEACVKKCPQQAITLVNGIPAIDYTKCTSCGECVEKCSGNVLKLVV
ncbi:MAG: 4Fe-4S binding protein [Spirochaetaceae bacterium]|jgi:Na+-translocating ferredoxin:NAD+ oxidoreductase RNF subunit RnfB|nr:4Fe-4S binding protein [Spirochaetaceae bacterium]